MTDPKDPDPADLPELPDDPPEANAAPEPSAEERVALLAEEVARMKDRWVRAEAELANLRARTQREVVAARDYAIQNFAKDVVEAAENLRRGLDSLPPAAADESELLAKLRGGFEGVERSFLGLLDRHGVKRLEVTGQPFDPELHQAMAEQPAPEGIAPGTVLQAWTPAWTLHGRLLKPAMVVVSGQANAAA